MYVIQYSLIQIFDLGGVNDWLSGDSRPGLGPDELPRTVVQSLQTVDTEQVWIVELAVNCRVLVCCIDIPSVRIYEITFPWCGGVEITPLVVLW